MGYCSCKITKQSKVGIKKQERQSDGKDLELLIYKFLGMGAAEENEKVAMNDQICDEQEAMAEEESRALPAYEYVGYISHDVTSCYLWLYRRKWP